MAETGDNGANFDLFRECLFAVVAEKAAAPVRREPKRRRGTSSSTTAAPAAPAVGATPPADGDGNDNDNDNDDDDASAALTEFSDYLASETFPSLPTELRALSHQTLQNSPDISAKWSPPLTLTTLEEVVALLPPSLTDSLVAYGLVSPPASDTQTFVARVLHAYVAAATTPPPRWADTRTSACQICARDWVALTYHHLIPRAVHAKVRKRAWHDESQLESVAWLCRACHSFVHRMASNEELAREWFTVDRILERDDVQRWAVWVGRVRWKKR